MLKGETVYIPPAQQEEDAEYFETYLTPIKNNTGEVSAVLWVAHDLSNERKLQETERKAQQLLAEEHRRLKEAQAVGHVGSFVWEVGSIVSHWSDELYCINGLEPQSEEITLDKVDQFIHPEDFAELQNLKELSFQKPGNYKIVHRIIRRDGEVRWVNHEWESIAGEEDEVVRVTGIVQDITKEIKAQQRIQQSESLMRSTETVANLGSYEVDLLQNKFRFSYGMYHLFGEEPGSFEPSLEWIDSRSFPDDIGPVKEILDQAIATAQPYTYQRRIYRNDGELRTMEAHGKVVTDAKGQAVKLIGLVQDITERKKAEEELRERTHYLQRIQETVPDMISITELATMRFYYLNSNVFKSQGFDPERLVNDSSDDKNNLVHADDRPLLADYFEKLSKATDEDVITAEYRARDYDGEWKWFFVRGRAFQRNKDSIVTHVLNVIENITIRKNTETEVLRLKDEIAQKATDKYKAFFNSIDEGLSVVELIYDDNDNPVDMRWVEVNPAFERITGFQNVVGRLCSEIFPTEPYWLEAFDHVAKTGKPLRYDNFHAGINKWIRTHTSRVGGPESRVVANVFDDITDRKQREQQQEYLVRLNDTLRQLADPIKIQQAAMQILGRQLKVDRVVYADIDIEQDYFEVLDNYTSGSGQKIMGRFPIAAFGWPVEKLKKGETLIIHDVSAEVDDNDSKKAFFSIDVHAVIAAPLVKNGKLVADLSVHQTKPRHWLENEIALIQETAERTWAAVERAKAEQALRESEERINKLVSLMPAGVYTCDAEGRITYYNRRAVEIWGREPKLGNEQDKFCGAFRLWQPDGAPIEHVQTAMADAVENGKSFRNIEVMVEQPDGTRLIANVNIDPLYDAEGKIMGAINVFVDITDRKKAEEQLRDFALVLEKQVDERTTDLKKSAGELEKNLTILQQAEGLAQIGSWEYNIGTGDFTWSEGMYRLFGLKQHIKVRPEMYLDYALEEDRSVAKRIINYLKKKPQAFEETLRIKRGKEQRLMQIKASLVTDEKGVAQKVVGVDLDITDLKVAEEKIAESQLWLQQTAAGSPDSISVYNLNKKQPTFLNDCLARWIGITNEELVHMGIKGRLNLIHPDDRLSLLLFNERVAAADGEVLTIEYRINVADDKTIWVRNRCKLFKKNSEGKPTHLLSFLQDITEETSLRQQLTERTAYAESLFDASIDRMLVIDTNNHIVGWNKRCQEMYRQQKEDVIGKNFFEVFPKLKEQDAIVNGMKQALKGEMVRLPVRQEVYNNIYSEIFFIPLKDEKGAVYGVLHVLHDITKTFVAKEELRELAKTLERKNTELESKHDEITSFAFIASHDLREPLRKIHTFSDWLLTKETGNLSDQGRNYLVRMNDSVKRLGLLIDDILALTQIHAVRDAIEEVDLNGLLKEVQTEMHSWLKKHKASISADLLHPLKGVRSQLYFLFKNLISNAVKFGKEGETPHLEIRSEIVEGASLPLKQPDEREYLKLSFIDNGIGIDEKYRKKIFMMFQRLQADKQKEGTGMGLAMCKKIMENHQGYITFESEEGQGATFYCYFPLL